FVRAGQGADQGAGESRLADAEVAMQRDDVCDPENRRETPREIGGCRLIGQVDYDRIGIFGHGKLMPGLNSLPQWDINRPPLPEAFSRYVPSPRTAPAPK